MTTNGTTNGVHKINNGRRAAVSLRIVVVGGGNAGLATAFGLAKAGHQVIVLERRISYEKGTSGGVLCVPANLSAILRSWGLYYKLKAKSHVSMAMEFLDWHTGESMQKLAMQDAIREATDEEMIYTDHLQLQNMMYSLAVKTGVTVRFGSTVASIDPSKPSVTLEDGTIYDDIDLVIGADGSKSIVRPIVTDEEDEVTTTELSVAHVQVSLEEMRRHPELVELSHNTNLMLWSLPERAMAATTMPHNGIFTGFFTYPFVDESEDWLNRLDKSELIPEMEGGDPRLTKLVELADHITRVRICYREPLEDWVHPDNKVLLVGDACHPMSPNALHKTSAAFEDAAALSSLLSRLQSKSQIPSLLHAYEEIRQPRSNLVQQIDKMWSIPEGREAPASKTYAALADPSMADTSQSMLVESWKLLGPAALYDVEAETEEWWRQLGYVLERGRSSSKSSVFSVQVSVKVDERESPAQD